MLERVTYRIGDRKVSIAVEDEPHVLRFWCDNWSDAKIDMRKRMIASDIYAAVTWAVQAAAKREPTRRELADMRADVQRFVAQYQGAK